jgi:CheY-like chemotaxis protein
LNYEKQVVLVVDDNLAMLYSVETMLRRGGYHPLAASGPLEALGLARDFQGEIHLLLADVHMPVMEGIELAEQIASERGDIRVLLMTGNAEASYRLPTLRKPFGTADLLENIESAIDGPLPFAADANNATLRAALDEARQRYLDAALDFNTAMNDLPSGIIPGPDGAMRIQNLRKTVHQAFDVYKRARRALEDEQAKSES